MNINLMKSICSENPNKGYLDILGDKEIKTFQLNELKFLLEYAIANEDGINSERILTYLAETEQQYVLDKIAELDLTFMNSTLPNISVLDKLDYLIKNLKKNIINCNIHMFFNGYTDLPDYQQSLVLNRFFFGNTKMKKELSLILDKTFKEDNHILLKEIFKLVYTIGGKSYLIKLRKSCSLRFKENNIGCILLFFEENNIFFDFNFAVRLAVTFSQMDWLIENSSRIKKMPYQEIFKLLEKGKEYILNPNIWGDKKIFRSCFASLSQESIQKILANSSDNVFYQIMEEVTPDDIPEKEYSFCSYVYLKEKIFYSLYFLDKLDLCQYLFTSIQNEFKENKHLSYADLICKISKTLGYSGVVFESYSYLMEYFLEKKNTDKCCILNTLFKDFLNGIFTKDESISLLKIIISKTQSKSIDQLYLNLNEYYLIEIKYLLDFGAFKWLNDYLEKNNITESMLFD